MTTTESRANISAATSLTALLAALRDTRNLTSDDRDEIDWTSLQTFGGDEPASTSGVWSWDAGSMIIGTCASDIKIVSRVE